MRVSLAQSPLRAWFGAIEVQIMNWFRNFGNFREFVGISRDSRKFEAYLPHQPNGIAVYETANNLSVVNLEDG